MYPNHDEYKSRRGIGFAGVFVLGILSILGSGGGDGNGDEIEPEEIAGTVFDTSGDLLMLGMVLGQAIVDSIESDTNPQTGAMICSQGGTATVTWTDNDISADLSAGDVIEVVWVNCDEGTGDILDGDMTMTINSYSSTLPAYAVSMIFDINLDMTGTFVYETSTSDQNAYAMSFDFIDLVYDDSYGSNTMNMLLDGTYTVGTDRYTMDLDMDLQSAEYGSLTFVTTTDFAWTNDFNPDQGVGTITCHCFNMIMEALSVDQVRLSVDDDKDGTIDRIETLNWDQL